MSNYAPDTCVIMPSSLTGLCGLQCNTIRFISLSPYTWHHEIHVHKSIFVKHIKTYISDNFYNNINVGCICKYKNIK